MTLKQHVTITTALTLLLGFFWKNYLGVLLFWLGGIFIDVDHYLDYIRETGDVRISLSRMEEMFLNLKEKKFYGLFHAYELIIIGLFLNFFYVKNDCIYGLLAGLASHIILDALFNPVRARFYFFLYRLNHSFEIDKCVKQKKQKLT
jgi:membrane-bound metal-dependent hydrolase YbcI (DUF457 family)